MRCREDVWLCMCDSVCVFFYDIIIIEGSKSRDGDITPIIFLAPTPACAESDLNATANGA